MLDESGTPNVHGAQTLTEAPGLYFVGIDVELSGLLREIAREASDVIPARERGGHAGRVRKPLDGPPVAGVVLRSTAHKPMIPRDARSPSVDYTHEGDDR